MKPLNIVYLHSHDLGRYCQPFGHDIPSPHIQRLAESGVLFRQAHSAAPTCSASRSALVTGRWPHCNGMFGLAGKKWGFTLNNYQHHIARYLKGNDYETAIAGVQHVAREPYADPQRELGYDVFLNHTPTERQQDHDPSATVTAASTFIASMHDKPFFLSVGFVEPHRTNRGDSRCFTDELSEEPANIDDRYCLPMPHLPDTPVTRRETANFKLGVRVLDQKMGAVIDAIDRCGLRDQTLIIMTTDHGPGFPAMKRTLTDRGTGVTLIMSGPEWTGLCGGKVSDALVSQMDLFPTLCDLIEIDKPDWLQGESLAPIIRGERGEIHDAIFTEQNYHAEYCPQRAVRTKRHKYIRRYDANFPKGVDAGPAQQMWNDYGWQEIPEQDEELYDLIFDPNEVNNLAQDPAHADTLEELRRRLQEWMESTNDPILTNSIPPPPGKGGQN